MKKQMILGSVALAAAFFLSAQVTFATIKPDPIPEPPPPTPPVVEPVRPHDNSSDRDEVVTPTYYPCCIMNGGGIRPKWDLFRTPEQVIKACKKAIERGNANIYACGDDYIAPVK